MPHCEFVLIEKPLFAIEFHLENSKRTCPQFSASTNFNIVFVNSDSASCLGRIKHKFVIGLRHKLKKPI